MSLSIIWAGNTVQETIPETSRNSIKLIKKHRSAQPREYFPPQWALWHCLSPESLLFCNKFRLSSIPYSVSCLNSFDRDRQDDGTKQRPEGDPSSNMTRDSIQDRTSQEVVVKQASIADSLVPWDPICLWLCTFPVLLIMMHSGALFLPLHILYIHTQLQSMCLKPAEVLTPHLHGDAHLPTSEQQ